MARRKKTTEVPDYDRHYRKAKLLRMPDRLWSFLAERKATSGTDVNSQLIDLVEREMASARRAGQK